MQSKAGPANVATDLVAQLAGVGERLGGPVAGAIARRGQEVIPALIEILEDESLALEDAPGGGHVPIHAATLLRDLNAAEAIEPMLRVLARCDSMDILYSVLIRALEALGPPVLEPALVAYGAATSDDQRRSLVDVLSGIGARDERVYLILLEALEREPELGAGCLAEYGDVRALPHLSRRLDACELDEGGGLLANQEVIELVAAIEDLGGTLTESQARKDNAVKTARDKARAPLLAVAQALGAGDEGEDPAATAVERVEILRRYERSTAANARDLGWIRIALQYGESHEGVSVSGFDARALRAVLFDHFPRKVSCEASEAPEIIHALRAFWTFAKEELAHPHAEGCLAELTDAAIEPLQRKLEDPSNFGTAKSFYMLGRHRGFAVETEGGLREWSETYNRERRPLNASDTAPSRGRDEERRKKRLRKLKKLAQRRNRR